jgi:hypothetical protein
VRTGRDALQQSIEEMETLTHTAARLQRDPDYAAPEAVLQSIKALVDTGTYSVFD